MAEKRNLRDFTLDEVKTIGEYRKELEKRTGKETSNQTIHYQLVNTDNLDYVSWCGMKLVILNEKASRFNPGESRSPRKSTMHL